MGGRRRCGTDRARLSIFLARRPTISAAEAGVFHFVNGLPDALYWPLWLPMQFGNLVVGTAAGLIVALVQRDLAVAVGVILAMALKLVTERVVRREMADYLVSASGRERARSGRCDGAAMCPSRGRASRQATSSSLPGWAQVVAPVSARRGHGCQRSLPYW